ncbi:MAG TPA: alpha/beta hydrolase [Longimicrobiales bacterium]|nr:alpha/beta hydrolase [Longimicrobiales bacterium]
MFVLLLASSCAQTVATSSPQGSSAFDRVEVRGGELEYRTTGRGEGVLLIHGSIFADIFSPMLNDPTFRGYRLITYNRRGFAGSSRAQAPFTIEQQAIDAIAVLDRLQIRRAHIVGASYGGAIALELTRRYPQRVRTLTLMEAAVPALGTVDPQLMQEVTAAYGLYQQGDARGAVIRFVNTVVPGGWDAIAAAGATAMQEQAVADAATFFEVELPALQLWNFSAPDAAQLKVPTLIMVGGESTGARRAAHNALLQAIPDAEEVVIFGAGHELQMKQPHAVAEAISKFLQKYRIP